CGTLTRPMSTRVDGNAYVRGPSEEPLVTWSPVRGKDCLASYDDLAAFRKGAGVEANGVALLLPQGSPFSSVDLGRFELSRQPEGLRPAPVPAEAGRVPGWSERGAPRDLERRPWQGLPGQLRRPGCIPDGRWRGGERRGVAAAAGFAVQQRRPGPL